MKRIKVAVLGGGVGAMTTAFELTRTPELRARYDVTVYQMGWRVGGKGASGRNPDQGQRIEEHGLHIWLGFYENAFTVMKEAYAEMDRPPGAPLRTWEDAFKKHSYIVLMDTLHNGTSWFQWSMNFPVNGVEPGKGGPIKTIWALVEDALDWLYEHWHTSPEAQTETGPKPPEHEVPGWIHAIAGSVVSRTPHAASELLDKARAIFKALPPDPAQHPSQHHHAIVWLIQAFMKVAWFFLEDEVDSSETAKKTWVGINLSGSAISGIIDDGVFFKGWNSIDNLDWRAWLQKHGANDTTLQSGPLRGVYDLVFGYRQGKIDDPQFAAGTAMRGTLRMLFDYRGAIMWEMQAGMGDTVFTPLHKVLEKRGVTFKFFHKVKNLGLQGKKVVRIDLEKQVKLKAEPYNPYVIVKELPCWPSVPNYDQIQNGEELKASGINLESSWAPRWKDAEDTSIKLGEDFDWVVIGMSVAALKDTCKELIEVEPRFRRMVNEVETCSTQAMQLWMKTDLAGLGWTTPPGIDEAPVLGSYVEPIDTWADMTHLLPREAWPPGAGVKNIAYFCGPQADPAVIPPYSDHEYPAKVIANYKVQARAFLDESIGGLWPKAMSGSSFDFSLLVGDYDTQFFRVNIDPTERYVLSVPNSVYARLEAGDSGFENVVLSGDWNLNGINAGCVEAATMGGMQAARAIHGMPREIPGETDL
jgi:uncharacterized protein with NAD-binding domain and iron-sulfur cluster